jgi:hypothetical protein
MPEREPRASLLLVLGLTASVAACALRPPAQNSGALAKDGVRLSVVRQRCTETVEPEWPGANLVRAVVEVQVRNDSGAPVTVRRDRLRLRGVDGRQVPSGGWGAGEPISIASGTTRTFTVEFMTRGVLSCTKPMQLDADAGIQAGASPIRVGSVTFVPSRA